MILAYDLCEPSVHLKSDFIGTIWNPTLKNSGFWMFLDFECFWILNGRISDPHCIGFVTCASDPAGDCRTDLFILNSSCWKEPNKITEIILNNLIHYLTIFSSKMASSWRIKNVLFQKYYINTVKKYILVHRAWGPVREAEGRSGIQTLYPVIRWPHVDSRSMSDLYH